MRHTLLAAILLLSGCGSGGVIAVRTAGPPGANEGALSEIPEPTVEAQAVAEAPIAGFVPSVEAKKPEEPQVSVPSVPERSSTPTSVVESLPPMSHSERVWPWDDLAACESGERWDLNVGLFDGGLQFLPSTWVSAGGQRFAEYAWQATREQQIEIAEGWLARTSWAQWPTCSRRLGLR